MEFTSYAYSRWPKSCFHVDPCKKTVIVLTIKVSISDLGVKVWTPKNELPQGNYLYYLTQPTIIRQRYFELMDIWYDQIKNEISRI